MEPASSLRGLVAAWKPHLLLLAVLAVPWEILVNSLRVDWTVNAQYEYGWAVPALCLYLLARRFAADRHSTSSGAAETPGACGRDGGTLSRFWVLSGLGVFLVLWALTRFIQEANPDWRLVTWSQALEVVGLTLVMLRAWGGVSQPVFPILFFLVAVPWPTLIELPVIQQLSRANAACTVEVLSLLGVPALQHGNTIEVGTGLMGIDDACSGIRSFQASLMLSLFFGEVHRLGVARRAALVGAGFGLAFCFNVVRTGLLAFIAATRGTESLSKWHDPAGVLILLACFGCLLFLARFLSRPAGSLVPSCKLKAESSPGRRGSGCRLKVEGCKLTKRTCWALCALVLLLGLGVCETAVELWYRLHESSLPPRQSWTFQPPAAAQNLAQIPLPDNARQMLRFTRAAAWRWDLGPLRCNAVFLEWKPGRVTPQLARFHNPEVCLSATGRPHETVLDSAIYLAGGLRLPFRVLRSAPTPDAPPRFLFYTIWEDRTPAQQLLAHTIDYPSRLLRACRGQRNLGLRALDFSVEGVDDFQTAETVFKQQLDQILVSGDRMIMAE